MSIFSRIFKSKQPLQTAPAVLMSATPYFTPFSGNAYESDVYRGAVDAIARHMARLKGSHYIKAADGRTPGDDALNYLLQVRPNPYMSAFDLIYKLATHYHIFNNAFAYIQRDTSGNPSSIYPLNVASMNFITDPSDTMYCKFFFRNGSSYILPYADIIHLRRNFNDNDLLGDINTAILPALQLAQSQTDGIVSGIKQGASIRGILKYNQIINDTDLKKEQARFTADYLNVGNNGGVVALDQKYDYTPINSTPYTIDAEQLNAVKAKIYEYLGVTQKIVDGSYDEATGTAFYESVVEPFAAQLSQEFTAKIFSPIEQQYGNMILFEAGSMDYASYTTRVNALTASMMMGLFSVDEAREILNMPPIGGDEGAKRLQTLNAVQADKAAQYQGVGGNEDERNPNS